MLVTSIKMHRGRNGQTEATIDATGFPARNEKTPPEALADPYVDVLVCTAILLILLVEACLTKGKRKGHRGGHICVH